MKAMFYKTQLLFVTMMAISTTLCYADDDWPPVYEPQPINDPVAPLDPIELIVPSSALSGVFDVSQRLSEATDAAQKTFLFGADGGVVITDNRETSIVGVYQQIAHDEVVLQYKTACNCEGVFPDGSEVVTTARLWLGVGASSLNGEYVVHTISPYGDLLQEVHGEISGSQMTIDVDRLP